MVFAGGVAPSTESVSGAAQLAVMRAEARPPTGRALVVRTVSDRANQQVLPGLRARRSEIERAMLNRVRAIGEPDEAPDQQYAEGLREAVSAALDFGFSVFDPAERGTLRLPPVLMAQARLAARRDVPLEIVLRRYLAGYTLFGDFLVREGGDSSSGPILKEVHGAIAALFDQLISAVTDEYSDELEARHATRDRRRAEWIQKLIAGELLDTSDFHDDFEGHHLGAIGMGASAEDSVRQLATRLDRRLLVVRPGAEEVWAWMGGRSEIAGTELRDAASAIAGSGRALALGEQSAGMGGWRMTHLQARVARPIALRRREIVYYPNVAVLATLLQDELVVSFFADRLKMLDDEGGGGTTARQTLRAYFKADRNTSSAAAALGVDRRTVANRLRSIEERLGRSLSRIGSEMELALEVDALRGDVAP